MTDNKSACFGVNLLAYHVEGKMENKANVDEVDAVVAVIEHLIKQGYSIGEKPDEGIGVITPYRVHKEKLAEKLEKVFPEFKETDDRIGTIHTFQGGEKDVIICSTKIFSEKHSDFFLNKSPNLLNVAVSRAKELFILVGNLDRLRSAGGYVGDLVEHIEAKGEILEINTLTNLAKEKLAKSDVSVISDCDHIEAFNDAVTKVKEELIIVSPWIRGGAGHHLVNLLKKKTIPTIIMYGWSSDDCHDEKILKKLDQLKHVKLIDCRVNGRGTHEKIVITDRKQAIVGSWNWLSHQYYRACQKRDRLDKLAVRHETSAVIYDKEEIAELIKTLRYRK